MGVGTQRCAGKMESSAQRLSSSSCTSRWHAAAALYKPLPSGLHACLFCLLFVPMRALVRLACNGALEAPHYGGAPLQATGTELNMEMRLAVTGQTERPGRDILAVKRYQILPVFHSALPPCLKVNCGRNQMQDIPVQTHVLVLQSSHKCKKCQFRVELVLSWIV